MNVAAVTLTLTCVIITQQAVLTPIQMLWVNLIMNTLASIALATEYPQAQLLNRPPTKLTDSIINKKMAKHILAQAIFQLIVMNILVFAGHLFLPEEIDVDQHGNRDRETVFGYPTIRSGLTLFDEYADHHEGDQKYTRHFTYCFNTFVIMQLFNFLNSRKLDDSINTFEGISKNPTFIFIVFFIAILQFTIVTLGFFAFNVATWGLGPLGWAFCFIVGSFGILVDFVIKFIPEDYLFCCCGNSKGGVADFDLQKSLGFRPMSFRGSLSLRQRGSYRHR